MSRRIAAIFCICATLWILPSAAMRAARHDAWVEVRSPNFIIVSNAGEKQARRTAIQFEQIHTLFREGLAVAQGHPSPLITIFALKDEKSLSELLPDYWTRRHMHPSGVFAYRMNQYYAAVYRGGFFAVRRRPEAKQILQNAVNLDPRLALAHQNLGIEEYLEGNRDSALNSISEAVKLDPKNGLTRYLRAYLTFFGAGGFPQDSQIEEDLRQAVTSQADFAPANALLGLYLSSRRQNGDEALMYAKKAVSLEPGNTEFIYDLAQVLAQMQRLDEAQYVAERARSNSQNAEYRARIDQLIVYLQNARSIASRNANQNAAPKPQAVPEAATHPSMAQEEGAKEALDNSREVTGVVMQESCAGGLKLQVAVAIELFAFRLQPGAHSAIHMMAKPSQDFDICKSLKGTQVAVRFIPDDANKNSGAIQLLTILAADTPASATLPKQSPAAPTTRPLRIAPAAGEAQTVNAISSGRVTAVACDKSEMRLTLLVRESEFELHARDYTRVHFDQAVPFDAGEFQPCAQLKDRDATIEYVVTGKEKYDGEIQSVEVGR